MKTEFELIEMIRKMIPRKLQGAAGIGDDTAVLDAGSAQDDRLFTTDTLVEGVDFIFNKLAPEKVGRKALAVNLSDIAAMGGKPAACVVTLGIPKHVNELWIKKFYSGFIRLAKKYNTLCVGGDISSVREFFVSVALLGTVPKGKAVYRSGAKPGDLIAVTGKLGGSILGHHYQFEPRLREAGFLCKYFHPTAMIDISDGFLQDLEHILKMSKTGASLEFDKIPVSSAALKLAKGKKGKALRHALTDGEDFELIFTVPKKKKALLERAWKKQFPKTPLSWVGVIQKNTKRVLWPGIKKRGYAHF